MPLHGKEKGLQDYQYQINTLTESAEAIGNVEVFGGYVSGAAL